MAQKDSPKNTNLATILVFGSALVLSAVGIGLGYAMSQRPDMKIEQGYLDPSKLEIRLEDVDENGEFEVLATYDGKPYMLTLDKKGEPKFQKYWVWEK